MTRGGAPRVGIDVSSGINQGAGIGRVTREAVAALAAHPAQLSLSLFYAREATEAAASGERWLADLMARHPRPRARRIPLPPRVLTRLWLRLRAPIPAEVVTGPVNVLWGPDYVAPPVARARTVVTVHDLSFITVPEHADAGLRAYLTRSVPAALRRAARVVAVSEATRRGVIDHLGIAPERVSVIYNGIDGRFRLLPPEVIAETRALHALPERFILIVGTLEPRKNHLTLIRAFATLAPRFDDVALVIAGRRGWKDEPIFQEVERLRLGDRVRFLGAFPDTDLPALYNAAAIFAYPSWQEGFGLPPLEAMACGVPVVTSTAGALPEVCGDAALLVEPADVDGLAAALGRLLAAEEDRRAWAARGPARAARFTWAAAADGLVEVFQRCRVG